MIDSQILKIMQRRAPNYHTFDKSFVKDHFSICPCGECIHAIRTEGPNGRPAIVCSRVAEDFASIGCPGWAIVAKFATCDAARRTREDYTDFTIQSDTIPQVARIPQKSAIACTPSLFDEQSAAFTADAPEARISADSEGCEK